MKSSPLVLLFESEMHLAAGSVLFVSVRSYCFPFLRVRHWRKNPIVLVMTLFCFEEHRLMTCNAVN